MIFGTWMLYRPDAVQVWKNSAVVNRLSWYYKVMKNLKPAKFMIVKRIEVAEDPRKLDYNGLWELHDELASEFKKIFEDIKNDKMDLAELGNPEISFLDVKVEIVKKMLEQCIFCERKCLVNRAKGERGLICRLDHRTYVHSWFHHLGEEAPLVPSGTIFYGSCNFRCVFCIDEEDYMLVRVNGIISVKKVKEVVRDLVDKKKVEVLTLKGWRKVKDVISRFGNEIYEVITNRGKKVKLTPEHTVIVQQGNELKEKQVKDLSVGDKLVTLPCNLLASNILNNNINAINIIEEFASKLPPKLKDKIRIKNVSRILKNLRKSRNLSYKQIFKKAGVSSFKYYWLYVDSMPFSVFTKLYRRYYEIRENIASYLISMKKGVKYYIPAIIKITPQFMRLLGYFVAEGNYFAEHGIVFTSSNETIRNDIVSCLKSIMPSFNSSRAKLIYRYKGKSLQIIVPSKLLYLIFRYVLGIEGKAPNKRVPWIVFNVNNRLLKEFLSAYLTGDGSLAAGKKGVLCIRFVTTSENMAYELAYILGLNNVQYRIREVMPSMKNVLPTGHRSKHKQFWVEVNGISETLKLLKIAEFIDEGRRNKVLQIISIAKKRKKVIKEDYVKELKVIRERRKVYDIIIDAPLNKAEEHVFFAGNGILIHNCQNYDISQTNIYNGIEVTAKELAVMQKELRSNGARNINHVGGDPTPNLHTIIESLKYLDVNVPQLWNSNMYLTVESMKLLVDIIDIWLPDFKYGNNKCAIRLSSAPKYFEIVTRNLKMAIEHGDMIIRHLVLPNHLECCTKPILKWIAENLPTDKVLVNIMAQYRPEYLVAKHPSRWADIARRPTHKEMLEAYTLAKNLGIVFEPVS